MSSKEALEVLRYGGYQEELYNQVEKDLEVLEALKSHTIDQGWGESDYGFWIDFFVHEQDSNHDIIKEWLSK